MTLNMPLLKFFYYFSFAGYVLAFLTSLKAGWFRIFKWFFSLSLILNAGAFVLFWSRSGHFPFCDNFAESYVTMGLVLGVMSLLISGKASSSLRLGRYAALGVIMVYAYSLGRSLEPSPYLYWYDDPSVFCFYFFRVAAIGVMFLGAAFFAANLHLQRTEGEGAAGDMTRGRYFLLLGAIFFLVSECCGAWWSEKATGDFWQFSPAFFTSAGTFLLFMIPFHWPAKWSGKIPFKALVGACVPVLILVVVMIRNH